jgi:hypothetical protein
MHISCQLAHSYANENKPDFVWTRRGADCNCSILGMSRPNTNSVRIKGLKDKVLSLLGVIQAVVISLFRRFFVGTVLLALQFCPARQGLISGD